MTRLPNTTLRRGRQVRIGEMISPRTLTTIHGRSIAIPDPGSLVHLQFRRFAGCPVCNLHLRSIVRRRDEVTAAGVHEIVLFHASSDEVRQYEADLPLDVVADPDRRMYTEFGVQRSWRALNAPSVIVKAALMAVVAYLKRERKVVRLRPEGGRLGQPADLLISPSDQILEAKYGRHAGDQWSVDDILRLAEFHHASAAAKVISDR